MMSLSRLIRDYNLPTGGTYDILFLDFVDGFGNTRLEFSLVSTQPEDEGFSRRVNGIEKIVQQFLKCLFTTKGSDVMNPEAGTSAIAYLKNGNLGDQREVHSMISQDVQDAASQVQSNTAGNLSGDEQLSFVSVLRVDVQEDRVGIGLKLVTAAGTEAALYAPFPRLNMAINIE